MGLQALIGGSGKWRSRDVLVREELALSCFRETKGTVGARRTRFPRS